MSFNVQNAVALEIEEGVVKTIHDKNNVQLWGAVGYDVKYKGDTSQTTYTGKNLFDYQDISELALSGTGGGSVQHNSMYRSYYCEANAGSTYTLSRASASSTGRCRVAFTKVKPANGVAFFGDDGVRGSYINADTLTEKNFTVPSEMAYIIVYLSNTGETITEEMRYQLEIGSTATSYEPYVGGIPSPNPDYPQDVNVVTGTQTVTVGSTSYTLSLGSIELAKIGSFQDYIYTDGTGWHIHREINSVHVKDKTSWTINNNCFQTTAFTGKDADGTCLCTHFTFNSRQSQITTYLQDGEFGFNTTNTPTFKYTAIETTTAWNQWLTDNDPVLYFSLATAEDEVIVDADLVSDLDAIQEFMKRYGYTATVSGNLPIIIDRQELTS